MRGAIRITAVIINVIVLAFLLINVWKLRNDFSTHWHYSFREVPVTEPKIPSLFSNIQTQTCTVSGKTGRRQNSGPDERVCSSGN